MFVGTGHDMPRVNHNRVIVMELTLIGAYNYDAAGFAPALDLLASGALRSTCSSNPPTSCSTSSLPTLHRLAAGELPGKVMVRPEIRRA